VQTAFQAKEGLDLVQMGFSAAADAEIFANQAQMAFWNDVGNQISSLSQQTMATMGAAELQNAEAQAAFWGEVGNEISSAASSAWNWVQGAAQYISDSIVTPAEGATGSSGGGWQSPQDKLPDYGQGSYNAPTDGGWQSPQDQLPDYGQNSGQILGGDQSQPTEFNVPEGATLLGPTYGTAAPDSGGAIGLPEINVYDIPQGYHEYEAPDGNSYQVPDNATQGALQDNNLPEGVGYAQASIDQNPNESLPGFTDPQGAAPNDQFNPTPLTSSPSEFQGATNNVGSYPNSFGSYPNSFGSYPNSFGGGYGSYGGGSTGGGSYGGGSYGGGSYGGGSYGGGSYGGGFYGGGGYYPIVLDLTGKGINIQQLSSSNTFFDMAGEGRQHLTAWAGPGNGVLFYDPTGTGQLTQANQMIFTDWDPTAHSDMQALLDVFDTNHDGALDAGDANFADFFVMETNADGTQTAVSLASLGITSIDLNQNATQIALPDGSAITGETTYTTSAGTGTAATVRLAADPAGVVITSTTTTNGDGSVTIDNTCENADGSVAYQRILNTLISSSTSNGVTTTTTNRTLSTVNAGGVVATLQTDNTTSSTNGVSTETVANYLGGTIASTGELTSAGTSGAAKLNSTSTTIVPISGGTIVTILRDQTGGGWTSQKEVDTTSGTGSGSYVVSNLNPDGSANNVTSTNVSNGGLTRTVTNLVDGNPALSTTSVDSTVVGSGTRTETITNSAGTTVTSLVQTVTSTTSNSVTRTTTSDLTDGSTLDLTSVDQTVTSSGGASTTTHTDTSANNTLLDQTVTTQTPQASGGLVTSAVMSELDNGAFIVVGSQTATISNAGGTKTTTVANQSANGTLLSERIATTTLGSPARTITVYGNGDGKVSQYETVTVSGGTTTDTLQSLNGDGSLRGEAVTTTSSGGLARTIQIDATGAGTAAAPVFDHITTDSTTTSAGTSIETVTDYGASTSYEIGQTQTSVSANGLQTTVSQAFTSASLASPGTWDRITTDQTVVNGDGSLTETLTLTDGAAHTLETVQKTTSANRQTVTTTTTPGTTNLVEQVETVTVQNNGTVQDQVVHFDQQGDVNNATVVTASADGLVRTVQQDIQGQSAAVYGSSGLAFDRTTTATTVINADGSRSQTTNVTSQNGTLLSTTNVVTSPNGLSSTITANPYATAHYATETTDATTLNADGSSTQTAAEYSYNQGLIGRTQTIIGPNGLSATVLRDFNGDAVVDRSSTDAITINADGSRTETVTDYTGDTNGTVRDVTTTQSGIIVPGAGLETVIARQSNGSVPTYQTETIQANPDGSAADTTRYYSVPGGPLLRMQTVTTSANGLSTTVATAVNGDTTTDFSTTDTITLNADGSRTETVARSNKSSLISETVTQTSANGLSKTIEIDPNGAVNGAGAPIFNRVITDNTVLNASDGSTTETITRMNANGATIGQTVTTTSADQQTITTNRYLGETGTITHVDQTESVQTQADGSVVDTITSYNSSGALVGTIVRTGSGNGLSPA
jgi:uncharacterized membrane protein YdcZ (DUF606 family)